MKIEYLPVHFFLEFEQPVYADNYPVYVLRSVLGMNLHKICCIAHNTKCDSCLYNRTCSYATFFESIVDSENTVLHGVNRLSHPFAFTSNSPFDFKNRIIKEFDFTITLFGSAVNYLPYLYAAFIKAGENGVFKSRTKFLIKDVVIGNNSILIDEQTIRNDYVPDIFEIESTQNSVIENKEILLELKTPLRFKTGGKYTSDFSSKDLFGCFNRRTKTMFQMYGDMQNEDFPALSNEFEILEKNIFWKDYSHYSARQKNAMELGGITGTIKLKGNFTEYEMKLLEFNKIANSGKNTNFGLGQIDYWIK